MYGLYQILYFTIIDIYNTLKSPFFLAICLIIYFQYYKINKLEKDSFKHGRSAGFKLVTSMFWGIIGGILTTILFIYLGIVAIPKDFLYILIAAILLSLINPRYMCFSYGASLVSLASLIFDYPKIQISQVMSIVAVLHIVESILILIDGATSPSPIYLEREGNWVGAYNMNRFWPIPFVIFIGDGLIQPITLMAILTYGDYSTTSYPRKKTRKTSLILLIYSLILLYIAKTAETMIIPPLFALLGHELIIIQNQLIEGKKSPLFTITNKGVRVLSVKPNSIAKAIGINIGDILLRINGVEISCERDMGDIMKTSHSSLDFEFFSHKTGLSKRKYKGNKKALGLTIVPRDLS